MKTDTKPGYYWVCFTWGWEPARFDGDDWLRCGTRMRWNEDVREIGPEITIPASPPPTSLPE